MQGAELNGTVLLCPIDCTDIALLGGFRYWYFDEKLKFFTDSSYVDHSDVFQTQSIFCAENNFYGGQAGIKLDYRCRCFRFHICGKLALGAICERAKIDGWLLTTDLNEEGKLQKYPGSYFAQLTNMGQFSKARFSVIPEINLKLGCNANRCVSFFIGYTFLYASNVLRASNEVSDKLNPTQCYAIAYTPDAYLVGKPAPMPKLKSDGLWVQGLTAELKMRF